MFTVRFQAWVRVAAQRVVPALRALHLTPNMLTALGLLVCAGAAVLVAHGDLIAGGVLLLVASLFDIMDGAVARVMGTTHRYGAFLDSTMDRYAEAFTYIALLYYFLFRLHATLEPMLVIFALTGSLLVSYVRARAQSLGFEGKGGLLARPERVVITVVGLIFPPLLIWALWILAVLSNVTAVQRIWQVWLESRHMAVPEARPAQAAPGTRVVPEPRPPLSAPDTRTAQ